MAETNHKVRKPDTESINLTYDELEIALVAMSIRQEELRDARSDRNDHELEIIWYVCDKMDIAQRNLESKMTRQVSDWLRSVDKDKKNSTRNTKTVKSGKTVPIKQPGIFTKLSRIVRL